MAKAPGILRIYVNNSNYGTVSNSDLDCYMRDDDNTLYEGITVQGNKITSTNTSSLVHEITATPNENCEFLYWGNADETVIYDDGDISNALNATGETAVYAYFKSNLIQAEKKFYTTTTVDTLIENTKHTLAVKLSDLENSKVDKVEGKGLSTNDLTNELKSNYDTAYNNSHTHNNKMLLDSYTQSNDDLASAVSNKHTHSNKSLLDTYTQTETNLADAVSKKHSHSNKTILDNITASYTSEEKTKLASLSNYDDTVLRNNISDLQTNKANKTDNISQFTQDSTHRTVTDAEKATWNAKLSSFTETDPTVPAWAKQPDKPIYDYSEISNTPPIPPGITLYSSTGQNTDGAMTQNATTNALNNKVDKVTGKGLSTNDFTTTLLNKLNGIAENATNVTETTVSDWGFTKNAGTVKSVNNTSPDADGNVSITIPTDTGMTSVTTSGTGNAVTSASYSASTRQLTLTKGSTFLTSAPVTSVAGLTGAVSTTNLVEKLLTGAVNYGDKIVLKSISTAYQNTQKILRFESGIQIIFGEKYIGKSSGDFTDTINFTQPFSDGTNQFQPYVFLTPFKDNSNTGYRDISLTVLTTSASNFLMGGYGNSQHWNYMWIAIGRYKTNV